MSLCTEPILRVLYVQPSARDTQLAAEILHEAANTLPRSYVFDVVTSNSAALDRVSRSDYRLVCIAKESSGVHRHSALDGRKAAGVLRRSYPELSVALLLEDELKPPPPPEKKKPRKRRKPKSKGGSPVSSMAQGRCALPPPPPSPPPPPPAAGASPCQRRPKTLPNGRVLPNSAVFRRRSSSSSVGISGGDVATTGGSASVSLDGLGARAIGAWRGGDGGGMGGGGGEPTSTDELAAPFASPPGDGIFLPSPYMTPLLQPPPRYVESPLSAYLKVVDYVLKKPFSDETFRVLLDATEDDHRRDPQVSENSPASDKKEVGLLGDDSSLTMPSVTPVDTTHEDYALASALLAQEDGEGGDSPEGSRLGVTGEEDVWGMGSIEVDPAAANDANATLRPESPPLLPAPPKRVTTPPSVKPETDQEQRRAKPPQRKQGPRRQEQGHGQEQLQTQQHHQKQQQAQQQQQQRQQQQQQQQQQLKQALRQHQHQQHQQLGLLRQHQQRHQIQRQQTACIPYPLPRPPPAQLPTSHVAAAAGATAHPGIFLAASMSQSQHPQAYPPPPPPHSASPFGATHIPSLSQANPGWYHQYIAANELHRCHLLHQAQQQQQQQQQRQQRQQRQQGQLRQRNHSAWQLPNLPIMAGTPSVMTAEAVAAAAAAATAAAATAAAGADAEAPAAKRARVQRPLQWQSAASTTAAPLVAPNGNLPPPAPRPSLGWAALSGDGQAREMAAAGADAPATMTGAAARAAQPAGAATTAHEAAESHCLAPAGASRSPVVRIGTAAETSAFTQGEDQEATRNHGANEARAHQLYVAAPPVPAPVLVGVSTGEKRGTEARTAPANVAPVFSTVDSSDLAAYTGQAGPPKSALSTSATFPVKEPTITPKGGGGCGEDNACPAALPVQGEQVTANGANGVSERATARVIPSSQPLAAFSSPAVAAGSNNRESQGRGGGTVEQGVDGCVAAAPWLSELEQESSRTTDLAAFSRRDRAFAAVGCDDAASLPLSATPGARDT